MLSGNVNSDKCEVDWPILILRGNGDIFVLTASIENKKKVKIDGPLPVYPPADDYHGMEDASSLIVLKSTPPVVVVATCNGNVYHSMLLSFNEDEDKSNDSVEIETTQPYHSNSGLYIFECIELELGVSLDDNADLYSSPICLYSDPYVPSRYFCLHEAGLHAVVLPIVLDLDEYAKCSEDDADQFLPSLRQSQSMTEYLICTRINAEDPSQQFSSPLLGFRIAEQPCFLIALSLNGELTSLPLTSATLLQKTNVPTMSTISDEHDAQIESFDVHIQNVLKPETGSSRPILKLDSNVPVPSETYAEILNQEIDGLREEYFSRYHTAIKDIERRIKLMSIMRAKQSEEVAEVEKKHDEIEKKSEVLNELCQKIKQKQESFDNKSREILEKMKRKQPTNTAVQRRTLEKLREYSNTVQTLATRVDEVCKRHQYQETKMKETADKFEKTNFYLSDDQQAIIVDNLRQMGEEISQLKNSQAKIKRTANTLLEKYNKE